MKRQNDPPAHQPASRLAGFLHSSRNRDWLLGLLLAAGTVLAYLPVWQAGFIWDDDIYISDNEALRSPGGLWEIWFKPGATCQYYPLSFTGFWLAYHLWKLNPAGYHFTNLLYHIISVMLLFLFLKKNQGVNSKSGLIP